MDFIVLWATDSLRPVLQAIAQTDDHHVTGWYESPGLEPELANLFPGATAVASPMAKSVHAETVIAVIVGRGGDEAEREEVLRELARTGIPMLLDQPPCSAIFAFELDMIQRDTGALTLPLHPAATHPAIARLADWIQSGSSPVGTIEQITFDRSLSDRSDEDVRVALSRDGLLLRALLGNFQQVSAVQAGSGATSLANLSVQLTGERPVIVRWAVGPIHEQSGGTLNVIGDQGRATLDMPDTGDWTLMHGAEKIELPSFATGQAIQRQLDDLAAERASFPAWEDACRAMDFAELATESVRRGRTLTVHNERLTEEDTFKSVMAAGGCLILMLLPFILLAAALVEGLRLPSRRTVQAYLAASQSSILLPTDVRKVQSVSLSDRPQTQLPMISPEQLADRYAATAPGRPEVAAVDEEELIFAPNPDRGYDIVIAYDGAFTLWRGWPILLLLPIALFLAIQLLKLAFPKRSPPPS